MGRGRGRGLGDALLLAHPHPLFQVRPGAETLVQLARQYQHPCPLPHHHPTTGPFPFSSCHFFITLALHGVDLAREFREELAGDGVAGAGVVEAEDADVARVRGGDVVGFYQGGCCCCWGGEEAGVVVRRKGESEEGGRGWDGGEEVVVFVINDSGTHGWKRRVGRLDWIGFFYPTVLPSWIYRLTL